MLTHLSNEEVTMLLEKRQFDRAENWSDVERAVKNAVVTQEIADAMVEQQGRLAWMRKMGVLSHKEVEHE